MNTSDTHDRIAMPETSPAGDDHVTVPRGSHVKILDKLGSAEHERLYNLALTETARRRG